MVALCCVCMYGTAVSEAVCENNENSVLTAEGGCSCPPGFAGPESTDGKSIASTINNYENIGWKCVPCRAGFYKAEESLEQCLGCPSVRMWSLAGQNVCQECDAMTLFTPKTQHLRCLPCAYEMRTVLSYVESNLLENGALQYESEDGKAKTITLRQSTVEEVGVHFYIDESVCVEKEVVTAVNGLLKVRKKCDAGQQVVLFVPTQPTICTACEYGTFSDQVNAKECRLLTLCPDATFWDAGNRGMENLIGTHGRASDSLCVLDFDYNSLARGLYPVIEDGVEFTFNQLRTHTISKYSPCTSSLDTKEAENTQIKCGVDLSSCMHDFFGQWKSGLISMGGSINMCRYKCAGGYSSMDLAGQEICQECVAGTYKNSSSAQELPCETCAPGSVSTSAKSQACTLCASGSFSSVDNTRCEDECVAGVKYFQNHVCYAPKRHYITDLSDSGLATHTVNVQMCPITETVLSSQHVWVQTDSESSKLYVEYAGVGMAWCFPANQCTVMQQVDISTGVCSKCDNVENAERDVFLPTGKCVPRCNAGFFLRRNGEMHAAQYSCVTCTSNYEAFRQKACGAAFYLDETCAEQNQNSGCLPCSRFQQQTQVIDTNNIPDRAFSFEQRCRFKCRESELVADKRWYYLDRKQICEMLLISDADLEAMISGGVMGVFPASTVRIHCIRSEELSRFGCAGQNMDFVGRYSGLSGELSAWPTLVCRENSQKTCSSRNAVEVLVQNTGFRTYQCHCKSGYYGTYDEGDARMLLECRPCPTYATSIKGTFSTKGCFCKAGTYKHVYPDETVQENTGIEQDLLCRDCLTRTTPANPSQYYYCPGGPSPLTMLLVFSSEAKIEAESVMNTVVTDPNYSGLAVPCAPNTVIRRSFAIASSSCMPANNVAYDSSSGTWKPCDVEPYIFDSITEWLPALDTTCRRNCRLPGAVFSQREGGCRCDSTNGYHLANNKCVCGPGWYLNAQSTSRNEMCVVCPRNSYCNGQTRALCPIEYMSDAQSSTLADCKCLPGFHSIQRSQRSTCASCSINYRCSGNGVNTPCRPEEQCKTRRMFRPIGCPRGSTKACIFGPIFNNIDSEKVCLSNSAHICFRNGLFFKNTSSTLYPQVTSLYSNIVQKNSSVFEVRNMPISKACSQSYFQSQLRYLLQRQRMPTTGFMGSFQSLCPRSFVLTLNTSLVDTFQVSLYNETLPFEFSVEKNSLESAFQCSDTPVNSESNTDGFLLINSGLAIVSFSKLGLNGFISESYHDTSVKLVNPADHLLWNVFLQCSAQDSTSMLENNLPVSEIDACLQCDLRSFGGFLTLGQSHLVLSPHLTDLC